MKRLKRFLLTTLIGGFVVLLPFVILVSVGRLIIQFVGNVISPLSQLISLDVSDFVIDLVAFGAVVAFCFLIGLVIRTQFGSNVFTYIEREWLEKVPAYSTVRDIVQQFTGARKTPFQQVVVLDPFGSGTQMTGFVTDESEHSCTVFVPTAPNPTNGFIFHVEKSKLTFVDVKTEPAMRTIVGMGVGSQEMLASPINNDPVSPLKQEDS